MWHDRCQTWNIIWIHHTTLVEFSWVLHKFQDIECSITEAKFNFFFGGGGELMFGTQEVWEWQWKAVCAHFGWCVVHARSHLSACCCRTIQPMILDQNYIALKTQVIKAERRVLKELGFCVHVKHPHKVHNFGPFYCQSFIMQYSLLSGFQNLPFLSDVQWHWVLLWWFIVLDRKANYKHCCTWLYLRGQYCEGF